MSPPWVSRCGAGSTGAGHEPGSSRAGSDRQALAGSAATRGQDAAPGTGAHAQPEAVHLVAAAVVRLVRTLAHELSPMMVRGGHAGGGQIARWRRTVLVEARSMDRGFGRHRPPTRRWSGPGASPGGAWTCGTRRHRVTEERYARRLRGVKSRARRGPAPGRLWISTVPDPSDRGFRRVPRACG